MRFLKAILLFVVRKVLSCRYRLNIKGLDKIQQGTFHNEGGIVFLPNHPAEIDPVIVSMLLEGKFSPRPLVVEHFYYMKGVSFFMKLVNALPIPVVESMGNKWKLKKIEQAQKRVKQGLIGGENFLVYPSGHLKREGYEKIGGNSFIHTMLQELPNMRIVLVRTTGLWGSQFSRARDGKLPDFWKMVVKGAGVLLRHAFVFCPKRDVTVEFEPAPSDFPFKGTRLELNQYLERWYNNYPVEGGERVTEEPLLLTPYGSKKVEKPGEKKKKRSKKALALSEKEKKDIRGKIAEIAECPEADIEEDHELSADLGLDSLDLAEIYTFVDQRYDVEDVKLDEIITVYDVYEAASGHQKKSTRREEAKSFGWPKQERGDVQLPEGRTLVEAFFGVARRMGAASACADINGKVLSYKKMVLAAIVLSQRIRKFRGRYIGIMLPSSIATYVFIMATLIARKIPVMINWTTGVRNLDYAKELLNLKTVISSRKFLNKVDQLDLGDLEECIILGEDIKESLSLGVKLKSLFLSKLPMGMRMKKMGLGSLAPNDPAVVLFTSGTESFPKAVPLSHRNILENQRAAISCVEFLPTDVLYGVLPPFHSFGFSVTGLFPLLSGMRAFFAPDPTDAHAMAEDVPKWAVTIFCCAPTFYRNLFRVATKEQLAPIRMFVTGAEKAGDDLFRFAEDAGGHMIEGYGITECSPIVSIVRMGDKPVGVGKPVPGVELCCVNPETKAPLERGKFGEIAIKGPNVFSGYLGDTDHKDAFVEIEGERWYASGDLGHIDEEGNLVLGGRLKRFVKIGGEMVSLSAIEEEIFKLAKRKGWEPLPIELPSLCVMGHESESGKPKLILFSVFDAPKEEINEALARAGFGRIIKISEVKKLDAIPLTGTSKVHLSKLKEYLV